MHKPTARVERLLNQADQDSKNIQRLKCKLCGKKFSFATGKPTYRQKKRRINFTVKRALTYNMCQRDIAELVGVNVKTIAARLIWQAELSRENQAILIDVFCDYLAERWKCGKGECPVRPVEACA